MILPVLLLLQTAGPAATSAEAKAARFERCVTIATGEGVGGASDATAWKMAGGGFLADQCLGMAYATQRNFAGAGTAFEAAARGAEVARDTRAAQYWAQAGNAWLAAGDAAKARTALDAALAAGTLSGQPLGEAQLDRARAAVASGDPTTARTDIDRALVNAGDDPLAWLLSATLARRTGDLPRARKDIAEAVTRASDDASVQLEAGNIAALSGDTLGARGGWTKAVAIAPDAATGRAAKEALAQFDEGK